MKIALSHLESPVGALVLAVAPDGLCCLDFTRSDALIRERLARTHPGAVFEEGGAATKAARRVKAYFAGDLDALEELVVAPTGTAFQMEVWAALRKIPVGATTSYGKIASAIGRPRAVRAVGTANGQNRIALVVPCHRVIGADGKLCGYAGGLWRKQWLLQHERAPLAAKP